MTREEFFYQCIDVIEHWLNGNRKLSDLRQVTDKLYNEVTRPHWISVDEKSEPPKEHEWIIGFSLKRSYVDIYNFDSNGLFEAHGITHWMHLSLPPIIISSKKGDEE